MSLATMTAEIDNREDDHVNFILDSGTTNHLVCKHMEELMTDVEEINPVCIKVANGEDIVANKKAIPRVKVELGNINLSINVLIVENLSVTLI